MTFKFGFQEISSEGVDTFTQSSLLEHFLNSLALLKILDPKQI
jgi:hypothetical protein